MVSLQLPLRSIAYARSGDKGSSSNIGLIAYDPAGYQFLVDNVTEEKVAFFFEALGIKKVERYLLPNLLALNFVLTGALERGGSLSLRIDSQGKALGQALLEMALEIPLDLLPHRELHSSPKEKELLVTVQRPADSIALICLNRPEKRNALNIALLEELCHTLELLAGEAELRAIVLHGAGAVFCAGLDLNDAVDAAASDHSAHLIARLLRLLHNFPLFTVAAVHGAAVAGGAGIMAACDYVVAEKNCYIAFPETKRGLIPAMVTALLAEQLGEKILREILLLGEKVELERAVAWGLINKISGAESYLQEALAVAAKAAATAPHAFLQTKQFIRECSLSGFEENMQQAMLLHQQARGGQEALEGSLAFHEKRSPKW